MTVRVDINRQDLARGSAPKGDGTAPRRVACQETARVERQGQTVLRAKTIEQYIFTERRGFMANNTFLSADEVAEILGVSKSYAYKIVRQLNAELKDKGFLTIAGRVNKRYFMEKTCYGEVEEKERW